ncbi:MAG: hypothetical protein ACK56F_24670, partial [bacterium]
QNNLAADLLGGTRGVLTILLLRVERVQVVQIFMRKMSIQRSVKQRKHTKTGYRMTLQRTPHHAEQEPLAAPFCSMVIVLHSGVATLHSSGVSELVPQWH